VTKSKKQWLNQHAKQRAEERYGINLNKHARREIVKMIQENSEQAQFVEKQSNSRSLWKVNYRDTSLNVVYDKSRSTLATVLPHDAPQFTCSAEPDKPEPET
jgi:AICAR transformylase/IMP cyclohydrolase PurH